MFLCKVDYDNNKFIYAPMYTYNEVMRLLELACVVMLVYFFYHIVLAKHDIICMKINLIA